MPVVLGVVVLVVVVVVGAVALLGGSDSSDPPESTGGAPRIATPTADALVVVERGGEPYHDQLYDRQQYGWAIVVTNTSDLVATDVRIMVEFQNADTQVVETREEVIHVLPPDDEVGVGGTMERSDVVRFDVTALQPTAWADPEGSEGYGRIVTSEITHREGDLGTPEVVFEADSTYDRPLRAPIIRVLLRNTPGDLIGGAYDSSSGYLEPEGHLREAIPVHATFTDIDPDKTEVYLDPVDLPAA